MEMNTKGAWILDAEYLKFDRTGLNGRFQSPYSALTLGVYMEKFREGIWAGKDLEIQGRQLDFIRVLIYRWSVFALQAAQHSAAINRAARGRRQIVVGEHNYPWQSRILRGGHYEDAQILADLGAGPVNPPAWRWPLRIIRNFALRKKAKRLPEKFTLRNNRALISDTSRISDAWLESNQLDIGHWEPAWFFGPQALNQSRQKFWTSKANLIVDFLMSLNIDEDYQLDSGSRNWLKRQLSISATLCEQHLDGLLAARNRLPETFLSTAVGSVWDRLMRIAVREIGGRVVSFEHGPGIGVFHSNGPRMHNWFKSSEQVYYSEASASMAHEEHKSYPFEPVQEPVSSWPDESVATKYSRDKSTWPEKSANHSKRILLVPVQTVGGTVRGDPLHSDITAVDFNARLIGMLRELGYVVLLRPHPFSLFPTETMYQDSLPVEMQHSFFEEALDSADLIVTCMPGSTTMVGAVSSGLPLLVIDPGTPPLTDVAMRRIKGFASLMSTRLDEEERLQLNWEELPDKLRETVEQGSVQAGRWY